MKNILLTILLILVFTSGFSHNIKFTYTGGMKPHVKLENLKKVSLVSEISPEFWSKMQMDYYDRVELDRLRKSDFSQVNYYGQSQQYNYNKIVDYVSVEIIASINGKSISAKSTGNQLTKEQKQLLQMVNQGTDIDIKISFKFKNQAHINAESNIKKGNLTVAVVPDTEAEYPGGNKELSSYFTKNVFGKVSEKNINEKIWLASVKFTVDEYGNITDAKMVKSSTDPEIDKLIIDQTKKMPKWSPAKDSKGAKIKQEFSIPFGGPGC